MRWLKNERCDFQERARVEDGESEVEEPDEDEGMDEEMDEDREKEPIEEIDWADVAEEERDESTDEDEEEELWWNATISNTQRLEHSLSWTTTIPITLHRQGLKSNDHNDFPNMIYLHSVNIVIKWLNNMSACFIYLQYQSRS